MSLSLPLKYRPQTFQEIVGQRLSAVALSRMVELGQVPQGLLFSGPSGSGKTSMARILARELGYDGSQVIEVDAASNRGVDNIRTIVDVLRNGSGGHVILLDEAHNLTREAFNTLLKTLEEPAPGTVFVLLTTEPSRIPDSVLSRLIEFEFRKIPSSNVLDRLLHVSSMENISISDSVLRIISGESDGNLRAALNSLELVHLAGITTVSQYRELSGFEDFSPHLVKLLLGGDYASIFHELDSLLSTVPTPSDIVSSILSLFKELLILRAGGSIEASGSAFEARKSLSVEIPREQLLSATKLLWDLRTKIRPSDDPRGSLEMTVILLSDILSQGRAPVTQRVVESQKVQTTVAPKPSGEKMSLSQMRAR